MIKTPKYIMFATRVLKPCEVKNTTLLMRECEKENKHDEATAYMLRQASRIQPFRQLELLPEMKKVDNL